MTMTMTLPTGEYQVDCFDANGQLIAEASLPESSLCRARQQLRLHIHAASFTVMRCIFNSLDEF